jgi:oxygen-independent coproporphyrinogen-3 oxidase
LSSATTTPTSIYIHIPFCVKKCPYCDFNSYGVGEDEPVLSEPYVSAVCKELKFYFDNHWKNRKVKSIFFGGGTPSLISHEKLERILGVIRNSTPLTPDVEVTLEANPGTVQEELGLEKLSRLKEAGFNRISFGSQSFSKEKLEFLGRLHSPEDIYKAVGNARSAGFKRLNLDLIFGVKDEKLSAYEFDIQSTLNLKPEHISAYSLTIEPGTEFGRKEKKGLRFAEDDEKQAELFEVTQKFLSKNNFLQYEVSNYALSNEECRHNLHYWKRGDYLGIGAGAHGFLSDAKNPWGKRWFNIPKPEHYIARVDERSFGHHAEELLTKDQAKTEFISLALRTNRGINFQKYNEIFSEDFENIYSTAITWSRDFGLVNTDTVRMVLSDRGMLFVNTVSGKFLV